MLALFEILISPCLSPSSRRIKANSKITFTIWWSNNNINHCMQWQCQPSEILQIATKTVTKIFKLLNRMGERDDCEWCKELKLLLNSYKFFTHFWNNSLILLNKFMLSTTGGGKSKNAISHGNNRKAAYTSLCSYNKKNNMGKYPLCINSRFFLSLS